MYCHYIGWCIRKCPLYRGVLYQRFHCTFPLQVLELCFKLYSSREPSVHNTAGVAIRQIVTALFERLSVTSPGGGDVAEKEEGEGEGDHLSREAGDAYLLFQVWYMYIYSGSSDKRHSV